MNVIGKNARSAARAGTILAALLLIGCGEELGDDPFGVVDLAPFYADGATATNPAGGLPRTLAPQRGFSAGAPAEAYDFGLVPFERMGSAPTVARTNPMYVFFDDDGRPLFSLPVREERTGLWVMPGGDPTLSPNQAADADREVPFSIRKRKHVLDPDRRSTAHQRPIIDVGPEALSTQYTGLWELVEVRTPPGYRPDTIKSRRTLDQALAGGGFSARRTGKVINCPLVDERTTIVPSVVATESLRPRMEVWYRRKLGFCLLSHGWETLARDGRLLKADSDDQRLDTFDVQRTTVMVGTEKQQGVFVPVGKLYVPTVVASHPEPGQPGVDFRFTGNNIVDERPRRSEADPTGFTPIRWHWDLLVPAEPKYQVGAVKSADEVDEKARRARPGGPFVRNLSLLGPLVPCGSRDAAGVCEDTGACEPLGLACNQDTCLCDAPAVGQNEVCAPGFQRCRTSPLPAEAEVAPLGFVCHPREPRGFCHPRCDASAPNMTKEKGPGGEPLDSRCGNVPGLTCVTPGAASSRLDDKKTSVCLRACSGDADGDAVCGSALMRCQTQRVVTGCNYDDSLFPQ